MIRLATIRLETCSTTRWDSSPTYGGVGNAFEIADVGGGRNLRPDEQLWTKLEEIERFDSYMNTK